MIDYQRYRDLLTLLESQPRRVFRDTHIIEDTILKLLGDMRMRHYPARGLDAKARPLMPRIQGLLDSVCSARSHDVPIDGSLGTHQSLVDHASRVRLGHEVRLDDPEFCPWLGHDYPNILRFLHVDRTLIRKTSTFVQELSIMFANRKNVYTRRHMKGIDSLCQKIMEVCPDHARSYAAKMDESYFTAQAEMRVVSAIAQNLGLASIEPKIPGSHRLADLSFVHGGLEHYVEVYSHKGYAMAAPQFREDIDPEVEWPLRFKKDQIKALKRAGVPTVYVMCLSDFQAMRGATETRVFWDAACELMPGNSEVVVILRDIEVASLRGGQPAPTSRLGLLLGGALLDAFPCVSAPRGLRFASPNSAGRA